MKVSRYIFLLSLVLLSGCSNKENAGSALEGIKVSPSEVSLYLDETVKLGVSMVPEDAGEVSVVWTSDNPIIAAVGEDGLVTAVSIGETMVYANAGKFKDGCKVHVRPTEVESVTVSPSSYTLTVGGEVRLQASVLPENATYRSVSWSSSDESVASVSQDGTVTALSPGEAVISATSGNGVKGECALVCKAPFSFSIEYLDGDNWLDASSGIVCYPSGTVDVRLSVIEGDGISFEWKTTDNATAVYAGGTVTFLSPGKTTLEVTASNGDSRTVPLESSISGSFIFGGSSFETGALIPVGNKAENGVSILWEKDGKTLPVPFGAYVVYTDSDLVEIVLSESGYIVKALGEAGDAPLRLKIGTVYDAGLCTVRVNGEWSSGSEPLDGEEDFLW